MKILITTDWYKPIINGVVTSVENLRKGLLCAGHEVRILTLSTDMHSKIDGNVYYVASVSAGMVYEHARFNLHMPEVILQDLVKWKPDIVHSQCEFSTFWFARKIANECQIPLVHTYHTDYEQYTHYFCFSHAMGIKMARAFSRKVLSDVSAVIVPSGKMQEMLRKYGIEKAIFNVPSGINMKPFSMHKMEKRKKTRERLGIGQEEHILLYVGRLAKEKQVEELFKFLKKMKKTQRMLVVGDGPYREKLEKTAETLGIRKQLIFTGMVPPEQIPDYYAAGDIFVSASDSETQGLTYMEAMACGLPLLCKADDCLKGVVVNGENGFLYHDEEEFLWYFTCLIKDTDVRTQMGMRARQSIQKRYSIAAFTASCLKVYSQSKKMAEAGL